MSVKDKEYLSFISGVNLDWQYVKLLDDNGKLLKNLYLNELLSPEKFLREYKDEKGRSRKAYIYGAKGDSFDKVNGLTQMQNSAGILMNYLEECGKNSGEGNFLKEWEVVYGADNYQIALDYLNEVINELKSSLGKMPDSLGKMDSTYFLDTFKAAVLMEYAPDYGDTFLENNNVTVELSSSLLNLYNSAKKHASTIVNENYLKYKNQIKKSINTYEEMKKDLPSREAITSKVKLREFTQTSFDSLSSVLRAFTYGIELHGIESKTKEIAKLSNKKELWENYGKNHSLLKEEVEKILAPNKVAYANKKSKLTALQQEGLKNNWISRGKSGKAFYVLNNEYYKKCEEIDKVFKGSIVKINQKDITKNLEIQIMDEEQSQKNIVANFLETLTGNMIGSQVKKASEKKSNTVSHVFTMGLALFTRANFADFLNTATGVAKECAIARINKDLYLPVEGKKGRTEGYEEEMPLFDTGFRVTVFKKNNEIVIACKKGKETTERGELKKLSFINKRIKKDYPNCAISFTGYEEGARIIAKYSLINYDVKNRMTLFYTGNNDGVQSTINFDQGDLCKHFEADLKYYVKEGSKDVGKTASGAGAGYLFAQAMKGSFILEGQQKGVLIKLLWDKPGALIGSTISKIGIYRKLSFLRIGGFWGLIIASLITIVVPLIIKMLQAYIENKEDKKILEYLEGRGWLLSNKNRIKGYITDKYTSDESIIIKGFPIEKAFGSYYNLKLINSPILAKLEFLGTDKDKIYVEYEVNNAKNYGQYDYTSHYYYVLEKKEGVYYYEKALNIDVYQIPKMIITFDIEGKYEKSRIYTIMQNLDVTLGYQRNCEDIEKNKLQKVIYLDYDKIKVGAYLPKETKAYYEKYYNEKKVTIPSKFINEYVFLPYMSSGNISNTIREDYVKNAYKEIIYIMTQNEVVKIKNEESLEAFVARTLKAFAGRIDYFLQTMIANPSGTYPLSVKMSPDSIDYKKWLVYFTPIITNPNYLKKEVILELVKADIEKVKGGNKYIALNIKMKDKDMKYGYDKNGTMFRQDRYIKVGEKVVKQMKILQGDVSGKVLLKGGGNNYIME